MKLWRRHLGLVFIIFTLFQAQAAILNPLPEIIPHRGGKVEQPGNAIRVFQDCVSMGARTLELDVQITKDSVPVVYHPGDLSANTRWSW